MFDFLIEELGFNKPFKNTDVYVYIDNFNNKTTISINKQENKDFKGLPGYVIDITFKINCLGYYISNSNFGFVSKPQDVKEKIERALKINKELLIKEFKDYVKELCKEILKDRRKKAIAKYRKRWEHKKWIRENH